MSDLIVIGYPDEATAGNVWRELITLQNDYLVDVDDAAIIRRDGKGRLHVTTPAHHAVACGTLSGLFWGVLGTVLQTCLPHDAEQQLMRALHGDDPAAPTWEQPTASAASQA